MLNTKTPQFNARYHEKAMEDVKEIQCFVYEILESLSLKTDVISKEESNRFCKYAAYLKVIRYTSLEVTLSLLCGELSLQI